MIIKNIKKNKRIYRAKGFAQIVDFGDAISSRTKSASPKLTTGFALLFSIMISSIILAIALGVVNIALKEVNFSTSAKFTNDAFFAADLGVECALYYDIGNGMVLSGDGLGSVSAFGISSSQENYTYTSCGGTSLDLNKNNLSDTQSSTPRPSPWKFVIHGIGDNQKSCAIVTVTKTVDTGTTKTNIVSKGYNTGGDDENCESTNPNRVERQLEVNY